MSRILRIDMSDRSVKWEAVGAEYANLGGRGLTSAMVCAEVDPGCHALGPNNKIVVAPGIVTGTSAATSGSIRSFSTATTASPVGVM